MSAFATSCVEPVAGLTRRAAPVDAGRRRAWGRYRLVGFLLGSGLLHALLLLAPDTLRLPTLVPPRGGPPAIAARLLTHAPRVPSNRLAIPANEGQPRHTHARPVPTLHRNAAGTQGAKARTKPPHPQRLAHTTSPTPIERVVAQPRGKVRAARLASVRRTKAAPAPEAVALARPAPPAASAPAVRGAEVRAVIERALQAHFYYPYVAQRNGWQGEIDLGLRIDANGRISDVHVVKSSGYGVLDRAAVNSARSIQVLPKLVDLLYGHTVNLVLPVRYRLYDG